MDNTSTSEKKQNGLPSAHAESIFRRAEVKYSVPADRMEELLQRIMPLLVPDRYPESTVMSIYYDTANHDLASRSLAKPPYKEKLRLRSYGTPDADTIVFPELKKKYSGIVYKRRAAMPLSEAEAFLNRGIRPAEDSQIIRELAYFRDFYQPVPALFVAYDRLAYAGSNDRNLRITFDRNIRYRMEDLFLGHGSRGELLNDGIVLMEIKSLGAMPLSLAKILGKMRIYPTSFSKFGAVYTKLHARPAMSSRVRTAGKTFPEGICKEKPVVYSQF